MNNNAEIQREAIIEIIGTQCDNCKVSHNPMILKQNLILKHQTDNSLDHDAVLLLTEDGKELGFLPQNYSSIYAAAIDSGRYTFSIKIVESESDTEKPVFTVKIISEPASNSEKKIESDFFCLLQNIVNDYAQRAKEYKTFIYSETVSVDELLSVLDKLRLLQQLISQSNDIIENSAIKPNSNKLTFFTKESLIEHLSKLKTDVGDILKKIQKTYNESLDIDDDAEYHRVQSDIREKRKRFRKYNDFLASLLETVKRYNCITKQSNPFVPEVSITESEKQTYETKSLSAVSEHDTTESVSLIIAKSESDVNASDTPKFTEQAFFEWLVSDGGVSESTAKQYISNIHNIEKLYQTLFGVRENLLGTNSVDNARTMIESLIVRNGYIDANERRHNSFGVSLAKFAEFADIYVEGLKHPMNKKSYQPPASSAPFVVKTVNFDNPNNCTYHKPCSFILHKLKYVVGSWRELYTKFLILLYNDNIYAETMKELVGKSLYGHKIDFADKTILNDLRRPIRVSTNFFAEGNLSAIDIIKHIKCLMELCSIANNSMVIEYDTQEKNDESAEPTETSATGYERLSIQDIHEEAVISAIVSDMPKKTETLNIKEPCESSPAVYATEDEKRQVQVEQISHETPTIEDTSTIASFVPDTTKPFVLKDAVIEILSSNAPEITKYRGYKNGLDSKNLRELIKKYYGKTINLFEISKTLMLDKTFRAVGKGCYIISATLQNDLKSIQTGKNNYVKTSTEPITTTDTIISYNEPKPAESIETRTEHVYKEKPVNTNYNSVSDTEQVTDAPEATLEQTLTIEPILEVIKENNRKLQYDDGFGAYEVKTLLLGKGFEDISEEQIENLMSECSELQQIEDGYYSLIDNVSYGDTVSESIVVEDTSDNTDIETDDATGQQEVQNNDDNRQIILRLNGDIVRAYDYSDALIKVCEFAINCKPFGMARIAGQETTLNGKNVFYRKAVPVDGYNKLSNGLQLAPINTVSDLQTVTNFIKKYCQIDDNMITIINQ